ncbi:hypothetical protein PIB30_075531 [Stylosanthes scabra]|uniref:Putative plant transposon protein domain-containing protein n=1 Tax=Stylosanthes scabra TaxID=79078 RepID=A0ABU6RQ55_9FABA|nr:hypothetical protein [Stylosanthes scabra]
MVKEFYANAWESDKEKRKPYTYTTMVRGIDISFAPSNIKKVLKLRKDRLPNAVSYHEKKANKDYRLEHVLEDLCIKGADWVRHKDGRPHYLRRVDLEPMTKGWYDFVCRSILPTTNRSELTVERAVFIHSIIIGKNINVEEIIADQIYKFVHKTDLSSKPPFSKHHSSSLCECKKQERQEQGTQGKQDKKPLNNNNNNHHHKCNHNSNKSSPPTSTLTLTPPCHRSIGGLTTNKKRVGRVLKPSTKRWTAWMTN